QPAHRERPVRGPRRPGLSPRPGGRRPPGALGSLPRQAGAPAGLGSLVAGPAPPGGMFGAVARAKVLAMAVVLGSLGGCGGGAGGGDGGGPSAANGTLFPWRELDPLPQPRVGHCAAVVGNYLVVIGGSRPTAEDGDLEASEEVWAASLGAGGNLGRWEPAGSTPDPVAECTAVARGDRLYLIGGRYDAPSQGLRVYAADLGAGGSLTTFT